MTHSISISLTHSPPPFFDTHLVLSPIPTRLMTLFSCRRCGEDIDRMLQPVTEELAEITRRERSAMDAILGGDQGADGDDDDQGVVEELGTYEEGGKRYGWTQKGVMVELGDDGGSQATLAGEEGENGGECGGDR
jgi:hypothetical protein